MPNLSRPRVFAIACLNTYRIPSAAMTPTIVVGDQILTSSYIPLAGGPGRCDIAVFVEEVDGKEVAFIKRIVGLAGDTVQPCGHILIAF